MPTDPATAYDWSFKLNWGTPFSVTREYKTDIFTSRAQKEQRRALRSTPRLAFAGETIVTADEYREFKGLMTKRQHRPFTVPDWSHRVRVDAAVESGDSVLILADIPRWLVEGRACYLYASGSRPARVIIESIGGGGVSLIDPVTDDWAAGTSLLPGCVGFLAGDMDSQHPTNAVAQVPLRFAVEPASEPAPQPAAATVTLGDREVCELKPNWADGVGQNFTFTAEQVDRGRGVISYTFPFDFPSKVRRASYMGADPEAIQAIIDLFDRMKGSRGEFYLASDENDLPPKTGLSSAAATLRVAGTETATFYGGSTVYAAVCVVLRNGSRIYRKVQSIATNAGDTVLTMTANWGVTLSVGDILMVCWMPVWRFASDELTLDYQTDSVAVTEFNLKMLEDLTPESL